MYPGALGVLAIVSGWLFSVATPENGPRKIIFRMAKIFLATIWAVAVGGGVYFMSSFSLAGDREEKVVIEQASPNEAYVASVVNSFGGAVVSNSTFVCIRPKGEKLKETKESIVFRVENVTKVGIQWNDNEQLTVDYDPRTVMYRTDAWRAVKVSYAEHRLY
ncbi:hypothetical protein EV701_12088 [Chthoniobacter flavus]|nr:hypothetical protein EV701_12088 [Chthoniobacter flavus]